MHGHILTSGTGQYVVFDKKNRHQFKDQDLEPTEVGVFNDKAWNIVARRNPDARFIVPNGIDLNRKLNLCRSQKRFLRDDGGRSIQPATADKMTPPPARCNL